MVRFTGIDKSGPDHWNTGGNVYVNPDQVIGVEQKEHGYHTFRPKQTYCKIHLSTGKEIEVFHSSDWVREELEHFKASARDESLRLAVAGLATEGGHHKQYFLERIVVALGANPREMLELDGYEPGVAP